mmetsp:Transcript_90488/g.156467  ORF Transcript_90488/g.156467 Transcript_90488/m.156467 type:complete len:378 (+) Transcript_90488:3-1136(+)
MLSLTAAGRAVSSGPRAVMREVVSTLDEFAVLIDGIIDSPQSIPEPISCSSGQRPGCGEATFKSRLGLTSVSIWYGEQIAERLQQLGEEARELSGAALWIMRNLEELSQILITHASLISSSVHKFSEFKPYLEARAYDPWSAFVKNTKDSAECQRPYTELLGSSLDLTAVEGASKKVLNLKGQLRKIADEINTRTSVIARFINEAPDEVRISFQIPAPICFLQAVLIGEDPATMQRLLNKLRQLTILEVECVPDFLPPLLEECGRERMESMMKCMRTFAEHAQSQLERLDDLLIEASKQETRHEVNPQSLSDNPSQEEWRAELASLREDFEEERRNVMLLMCQLEYLKAACRNVSEADVDDASQAPVLQNLMTMHRL